MEYYLYVFIKLVLGFLIVIIYMNITGKTQLNQMTPVDFIGNFILGGIIGGIIYNENVPLYQFLIVLFIGIALIYTLDLITRKFQVLRAVAIGNPIPIIKNGKFLIDNIKNKKHKIDILNVASSLRAQGIYSFDKIYHAQIEPSGQITVIKDEHIAPGMILVKEGKIIPYYFSEIEKDEKWLKKYLEAVGIKNMDDIFFAEYSGQNIRFILNDGTVKKIEVLP